MTLRSPLDGSALQADTAYSLRDGSGTRWPVVDDIPYLRTGREDLISDVLHRLDRGDGLGAQVELLRDADDWWDGAPPDRADVRHLLEHRDVLSLRDAMIALGYGRVGDYFAHRWTDPTFVAGLSLIEAHWRRPQRMFELACGIGQYLRELRARGCPSCLGADVVFSKLWLARHYLLGTEASLVCFDAASPWPIAGQQFDLVLCQDAFYFLDPKPAIAARLKAATDAGGTLLIGHIHNSEAANHSAGTGLTAAELDTLFPQALAYDDAELSKALLEQRRPEARPTAALRNVDAFALAHGPSGALPVEFRLAGPKVRRNPLYEATADGWRIAWPSERYAAEYGPLATYPVHDIEREVSSESLRRRIHVDLPERW